MRRTRSPKQKAKKARRNAWREARLLQETVAVGVEARVAEGLERLGYKRDRFDDYLADAAAKGKTLVRMAREMRVPAPTFIGYHARYIESLAKLVQQEA